MTEPFATPIWTEALSAAFVDAAGPRYELLEGPADRHGSWEWVAQARDNDQLRLVAMVSPLDTAGPGGVPTTAIVTAWQDCAGKREAPPVLRKRLRGLDDHDGVRRMSSAVQELLREAAVPRRVPSAALRHHSQSLVDSFGDAATPFPALRRVVGIEAALTAAFLVLTVREISGESVELDILLGVVTIVPALLLVLFLLSWSRR